MLEYGLIDQITSEPILIWTIAAGFLVLLLAVSLAVGSYVKNLLAKRAQEQDLAQVEIARSEIDDSPEARLVGEIAAALADETPAVPENQLADSTPLDDSEVSIIDGNKPPVESTDSPISLDGVAGEQLVETVGAGIPAKEEDFDVDVDALDDIFREEVIIDPHLQSLWDSLPSVKMVDLVNELREVKQKLAPNASYGIGSEKLNASRTEEAAGGA